MINHQNEVNHMNGECLTTVPNPPFLETILDTTLIPPSLLGSVLQEKLFSYRWCRGQIDHSLRSENLLLLSPEDGCDGKKWHLEVLLTPHLGFGMTQLALSFRT